MKTNKTIYFYIGTIAELIKLASVLKKFNMEKISYKIITSGQNEINFNELEAIIGKQNAHIAFPTKNKESSSFNFALWAIKTFFISLLKLRNEFKKTNRNNTYFIVHGDTVSALIGALIGKFYNLKVIHIEAGYRSFNFFEPFPEEITRVLISFLADVHFCPDDWSLNNIKNRSGLKVSTGENTLYETCMKVLKMKTTSKNLLRFKKMKYFVLVLHRQEHVMYKKDLSKKYINILASFASSKLKCVFVLHKLTENFIKEQNLLESIKKNPYVITIPRLPYLEFLKILEGSEFVATDGGSNQDEAYFLGKPCLLLRKYTEQVEGLNSNIVLAEDDLKKVEDFLKNYKSYKKKRVSVGKKPSTIIAQYFLNDD